MAEEFFFLDKAQDFNVDEFELNPIIKDHWQKSKIFRKSPENYKKKIQRLLELLEFKEDIRILDVGCGAGRTILELAFQGGRCVGIDATRDSIRLINAVKDQFKLVIKGIYCDACKLPFKSEMFDVVLSESFFEHVTDIDDAIKEQIRILKIGGRLYLSQANFFNPWTLYDLLIKYPSRTKGEYGGIKWLLTKWKIRKNIYRMGWEGKDEDIHTRFWWRKKIRQIPNLRVKSFISGLGNPSKGRLSFIKKIYSWLFDNIYIVAIKIGK